MPWETVLPETAKALSQPVTKLIEVVAAGCGKLYEPSSTRRQALADADALVIMEEARARASEISKRAARRLLDVEERRQQAIEQVVREAAIALPDEVSPAPVDPDWAARFFSEVQDIGNEQMQSVWARLLAGEVATPGSFSQRTLVVLRNLSPEEAQLFNVLCKNTFRGTRPDHFYPMVTDKDDREFWKAVGLDFLGFRKLEEAGLIAYEPLGMMFSGFTQLLLRGSTLSLLVQCQQAEGAPVNMGRVSLTVAGRELANICEWEVSEERVRYIHKRLVTELSRPYKVSLIRITADFPDGVAYDEVSAGSS